MALHTVDTLRGCGSKPFVGASRPSLQIRKRTCAVYAMSDADLLRKPDLKKPELAEGPKKLFNDSEAVAAAPASPSAPSADAPTVVTIEYQRQRAKEMRKYFQDLKAQQIAAQAQVFGWTAKNEIGNGRWVMFGVGVGLLTEYATGVDFVDQLKLMVSYLGILDLEP